MFITLLLLAAALLVSVSEASFAASKPGKVTALSAKAVSSHSVKLSWKKVKGAGGYQIYKVSGKKSKRIATVKGGSKQSYTVKKLKTDGTYTFKVRAYKKKTYGSFSRKVSIRVTTDPADYKYGVFLSVTSDLEQLSDYKTVVIDAQYFSKEEIDSFKSKGHKVYSYINVGSIEDFRSYFNEYKDLTLGKYENWDEEYWVDVSDPKWQSFMKDEMIPSLLAKDIDGFFVDNCDVYYHYPKAKILDGLAEILHAMTVTQKAVLINGGDTFLDAYCNGGGAWDHVCTGINQETVFSRIIWDKNKFGTAKKADKKYFKSYIERYAKKGADIYLLEYTTDRKLVSTIRKYCKKKKFGYYISDSIELDH